MTTLRCHAICATAGKPVADRVTLDLEARRKRRHVVETAGGLSVLIDLEEAPQLLHGDGLVLEDGRIVRVEAEPEPLLEIRHADLVRIAWHLGNRHTPTEIGQGFLRIREDHVLEHMLEGLGARLAHVSAVFEPESGAYGHHQAHG